MSPHAGFVLVNEIVPRLKCAIPNAVSFVGCEDPQELIQDAIAFAARLLHNAEVAGKNVTAGNIAYYTIRHIRSGRRSTGSSRIDVMAAGTQLSRSSQVVSLEEPVPSEHGGSETFVLGDVLSADEEDPAILAMRRLDWESFCATQPARSQAILSYTAEGRQLTELAQEHHVSRSTLQENKNVLARAIKEFMGEDILQESVRSPAWMNNLMANRERTACKKTGKR